MGYPTPSGPPQWFQTYRVTAPTSTHWRKASCEEVGCTAFLKGWKTEIYVGTDLGQRQFNYITKESRRRFKMTKTGPDTFDFVFEPGQPCFGRDKHKVRLDRPEHYSLILGDWRQFEGVTTFKNSDDWVSHFAEHQGHLNDRRQQG